MFSFKFVLLLFHLYMCRGISVARLAGAAAVDERVLNSTAFCAIQYALPAIAPVFESSNVTVYFNVYNITLAATAMQTISIRFGSDPPLIVEPQYDEICTPSWTINTWNCSIVVETPIHATDEVVFLSIKECNHSRASFQFYEKSQMGVRLLPIEKLDTRGGVPVYIEFTHWLLSTLDSSIRITNGTQAVVSSARALQPGTASIYLVDVLSHSPTFQLSAMTDDQLQIFENQNVWIEIAFDGLHFQDISMTHIPVVRRKDTLSTIHFYPHTWTKQTGWEWAIHVGLLEAIRRYTLAAISYTEVENQPITEELVEKHIADGKYDVVFFWSWSIFESQVNPIALKYPNIQFVISGPGNPFSQEPSSRLLTGTNPNVLNNTNYIFPNIYHCRYLAGVLVGLMMNEGDKVCAITKFANNSIVRASESAFIQGVLKTQPYLNYQAYSPMNVNSEYETYNIAQQYILAEKCSILTTTYIDLLESQQVFSKAGKLVIGTNSDSRLILGNYALTSPSFNWENILRDIFDSALNNSLGGKLNFQGYGTGAVYMTSLSPIIPISKQKRYYEEEQRVLQNPYATVLCGPAYDVTGNLRIEEGECPTVQQIYSMNWDFQYARKTNLTLIYPAFDDGKISQKAKALAFTFVSIFIAVLTALIVWTSLHRSHASIKFSQPQLLCLTMAGGIVGLSSVFVSANYTHIEDKDAYYLQVSGIEAHRSHHNDELCYVELWLLTLGYLTTFYSLSTKIYRLHKLVMKASENSIMVSKRKHVKWTKYELFLVFLAIVPLIPLSILKTETYFRTFLISTDIYDNPIESLGYCTYTTRGWYILTIFFVLLLLIFFECVRLCFIARHDESVNHDVIYIFMSIFNFLQMFTLNLIGRGLVFDSNKRFLMNTMTIVLALGGICASIMVPKLLHVYFPQERDSITITTGVDGKIRIVNARYKDTQDTNSVVLKDDTKQEIIKPQDFEMSSLSSQRASEGHEDIISTVDIKNPIFSTLDQRQDK